MIGGKWKPDGVNRVGAMQRAAPGCSEQNLREMETDGLTHREIFAESPPRGNYSPASKGESPMPVIAAMRAWGEATHD